MIWFFLAGMIAGAVGASMFIWWWFKKNVRQVSKEEMMRALAEMEADKNG